MATTAKWPLSKHKNGCYSADFTVIELELGVVVADHHPQHIVLDGGHFVTVDVKSVSKTSHEPPNVFL